MPRVLIGARELAHIQDRFRDVLEAAGLEPAFPDTGRPGQLNENELITALAGVGPLHTSP